MQPSIFLSHSCKDRDLSPPAGLSVDQQRGRAERLEFARRLRRRLFDRLQEAKRYQVWLDVRGGLQTGQNWRDGIHQALGRCSGAVILLSPEALQSGWVLKETTILLWRAFLGERVLVIPVLLGVGPAELVVHGFEPAGVTSIQAEVVPDGRCEVDEVVDRIIARFADWFQEDVSSQPSTRSSPVDRWLDETARLLHEDDERYARMMFEVLQLEYGDAERFGEPFRTVANELLVTGTDEILDVLDTLAGVRTADQKAMLRRAVEALWVNAGAANRVPLVAARADPPRIVAIDGDEPITGRQYVDRAYCGKIRADRIFAPDDHTDGSREQTLARIEDLLAGYLPVRNPQRLAADLQRNGPVYLVLGPTSCRIGVVDELMRRYPTLTVIALIGRDPATRAVLPAACTYLAPPLGEREDEGRYFRNRLASFA